MHTADITAPRLVPGAEQFLHKSLLRPQLVTHANHPRRKRPYNPGRNAPPLLYASRWCTLVIPATSFRPPTDRSYPDTAAAACKSLPHPTRPHRNLCAAQSPLSSDLILFSHLILNWYTCTREGEKRPLNPYECFSARLAVFGTSKPPQKKSEASGSPGTLVQSSWGAALSMFWPQAAPARS